MRLWLASACFLLFVAVVSAQNLQRNVTYGIPLVPSEGGGVINFKTLRTFPHAQTDVSGPLKKIKIFNTQFGRRVFVSSDNTLLILR